MFLTSTIFDICLDTDDKDTTEGISSLPIITDHSSIGSREQTPCSRAILVACWLEAPPSPVPMHKRLSGSSANIIIIMTVQAFIVLGSNSSLTHSFPCLPLFPQALCWSFESTAWPAAGHTSNPLSTKKHTPYNLNSHANSCWRRIEQQQQQQS